MIFEEGLVEKVLLNIKDETQEKEVKKKKKPFINSKNYDDKVNSAIESVFPKENQNEEMQEIQREFKKIINPKTMLYESVNNFREYNLSEEDFLNSVKEFFKIYTIAYRNPERYLYTYNNGNTISEKKLRKHTPLNRKKMNLYTF